MNARLGLITRCRNEPYVNEFVNHYVNEGVDAIYIIDDQSKAGLYKDVSQNPLVRIVKDITFANGPEIEIMYSRIKDDFDWVIIVDMDEYVTTKHNAPHSLKNELLTTFKDADCVKIPWVMMAFNGIEQNPECLLETNIYRWNHDKKHRGISREPKFRCRYEKIEVKCAFKTKEFDRCWYHGPLREDLTGVKVVDGVYNSPAILDPYYNELRENDISQAFLLCFHYRGVSKEQCKQKIAGTHLKRYKHINVDDFISCDYPEIIDTTLCSKSEQRPKMFLPSTEQ
ncbi:MAG: glycosyltransferase family 92 protein [Desulfobulbaceae bacterium]|nr:glycosyltransferase family 92 protein [Desulfobulbaceae bacterium]